jgi:hypothetical protein
MKQACKVQGGVSRHECEKHWRRNIGRLEKPTVEWIPGTDVAKEREIRGRCSTVAVGEQVKSGDEL